MIYEKLKKILKPLYANHKKWLEENGFWRDGKIIGNPFNKVRNEHYRYNKPYLIDKYGYRIDPPQRSEKYSENEGYGEYRDEEY